MILMILLGPYLPTACPSISLTTTEEVLEVESDVNVSPGKDSVSRCTLPTAWSAVSLLSVATGARRASLQSILSHRCGRRDVGSVLTCILLDPFKEEWMKTSLSQLLNLV